MSINDQLDRVRKPRVHIKYDVETEGASISKELPLSVASVGDYAGPNPGVVQEALKDRSFVNIDRDNFDSVMAKIEPGVNVRVENTLLDDQSELSAHLIFKSIKDFEPDRIIDQVEPLKALKKTRDQLVDLLTKADVSDELELLLERVLQDSSCISELSSQLQSDQENADG